MELNKPNTPKTAKLKVNGINLANYYKYYFLEKSLKEIQNLVSFEQGRILLEWKIIEIRIKQLDFKNDNIVIFLDYLSSVKQIWKYNETKTAIQLKYNLQPYKLGIILADARRQIATEIQKDIENGLLHREPEPPKKRKKSDLQIYNEFRKNNGLKPFKAIGQKTALKNYLAQIEKYRTEPTKDYQKETKPKDSV